MQPLLRQRKQNNAPRLRDLNAGGNVFGKEQLLNGHLVRVEGIDQRADIIIYLAQAQTHRHTGLGRHRAVLYGREFEVFIPHHTVAYRAVAGVDAENDAFARAEGRGGSNLCFWLFHDANLVINS